MGNFVDALLVVVGVGLILWSIKIEGIEAPNPTTFSRCLFRGGIALILLGVAFLVWQAAAFLSAPFPR